MRNLLQFSTLLTILFLVGCSTDDNSKVINYNLPEAESDGISVGSAIELGLDVGLLSELTARNENGIFENVHAVLVAKDNQLIYEEYFEGKPIYEPLTNWDKHSIHRLHSVTKSFNSALIGIAIEHYGLSLKDQVKTFFPEMDEGNWEGMKSDITIEHLLTMSSGLQWDEWSFSYDDPRNDHSAMNISPNWVHFVLEKPLVSEPGSQFIYNSGLSITLGEIIRRKSGKDVGLFARDHLFEPMGITNVQWDTSPISIYQTGGGLRLRPRDMLKFGLLFLNKGKWNDEQLVSPTWVASSSRSHGPNIGYSYQWWLNTYSVAGIRYDAFMAAGRGGQYIIVIDRLNLVVVFTAGNDNALSTSQTNEMMEQFILPSIIK